MVLARGFGCTPHCWHRQSQAPLRVDAKSCHASQLVGAGTLLEQGKGKWEATHDGVTVLKLSRLYFAQEPKSTALLELRQTLMPSTETIAAIKGLNSCVQLTLLLASPLPPFSHSQLA